jgi:hypothetical protein
MSLPSVGTTDTPLMVRTGTGRIFFAEHTGFASRIRRTSRTNSWQYAVGKANWWFTPLTKGGTPVFQRTQSPLVVPFFPPVEAGYICRNEWWILKCRQVGNALESVQNLLEEA